MTDKFRAEALALLATDAYLGDHDFEGDQLDAWVVQRDACITALALIATGQPLTTEVRDAWSSAPCPRSVVDEEIEEEEEVEEEHTVHCRECGEDFTMDHMITRMTTVTNPEWSNGTVAGADWTGDVGDLITKVWSAQITAARALAREDDPHCGRCRRRGFTAHDATTHTRAVARGLCLDGGPDSDTGCTACNCYRFEVQR